MGSRHRAFLDEEAYVSKEEFFKISYGFGKALEFLKAGGRVSRKGWKGMFIALQVPDKQSKMSLPYIYVKTVNNQWGPWLASQTDILAEDWIEVE